MLGIDHIGTTTLNLLNVRVNYDTDMRQIPEFYHEEGIDPLHATTLSIVRFSAWLGQQGIVDAASLQQYYSAVNKFFRDHQYQPIAVGELFADARRGLEMMQHRLLVADSRLLLPTPLALALLDAATHLRKHLTWTPPTRHVIARFRATHAVCTNYAFSCRAES
jgi:hypothetical protein